MSEQMTLFECGLRINGRYCQFMESNNRESIDEYINIMRETNPPYAEILFLEKTYELVSSTPYVIMEATEEYEDE